MNNRLFVYGIFLGENQRRSYGMVGPEYAVVPDYATLHLGHGITGAAKVEDNGLGLTGLLVTMLGDWQSLDRLESGYHRIKVETTDGDKCWMYVL